MARAINVKIPTAKVIEALENKLAELQEEKETYPARRAQFEADFDVWKLTLAQMVDTTKIDSVQVNERRWSSKPEIDVLITYTIQATKDIPERPEPPANPGYREREMEDNIENALRILKMTEQTEVSASTYNSIAQYL